MLIPRTITPLLAVLSLEQAAAFGIEYGYHDPEVVARGNAGAASATGPSAVYYNPALLGDDIEPGLLLSGYVLDYHTKHEIAGGSDHVGGGPAVAASAFAALPISDDTSFAFGLYSPFGQKNEIDDLSPLRNLALHTELIFLAGTAAIGTEIAPGLQVGLSASIVHSEADFNRGLAVPGDRFQLTGDGLGWGLGGGIVWEPVESHRFAASLRWWSPVEYEGEMRTRFVFPAFAETIVPASTELDFPREWTLGYAWEPNERWLFEIDLMFTEWSSFDRMVVDNPAGSTVEPLDWDDGLKLATGVRRRWDNGWWAGAGYWYADTVGPDLTFNPRLPDVPIHVFSLGTGFRGSCWAAELTYQYGYGESRTVRGSLPTPSGVSADGRMTYHGHGFTFGLRHFW